MSERLTSVVAGVVTTIVLGGLSYAAGVHPAPVAAIFVCLVGVALWRRIGPAVFAAAVIITLGVAALALFGASLSSNLAGLVVIGGLALLEGAVAVVALAAVVATMLRRRSIPRWLSPGLCGIGLAVLIAAAALKAQRQADNLQQVRDWVGEIRRAEMAYADRNSSHSFTCDGPNLPGLGSLEWTADPQLGGRERDRGHLGEYWIYLRCAASARPQSMTVSVVSTNGNFQIEIKR